MHTETPTPIRSREYQKITEELDERSEESTLQLYAFACALAVFLWLLCVLF